MITTRIYFVRHAESPYVAGMERKRGLSDKGLTDSEKVKYILMNEHVEVLISSPYERAILTIQSLADELNQVIELEEDFRERELKGEGIEFASEQFREAKRKVYEDWDYAYSGGESSKNAQERAVTALNKIMEKYSGKRIVIATHGDIMTLMLNHWDSRYDYSFWTSTTMPDIYRAELECNEVVNITRLWD